jgi:alkylation response protein AidB-like acyl-CoA dehydrogenase
VPLPLPDFTFGPELSAFRSELRDFLGQECRAVLGARPRDLTDLTGWPETAERELLRRAGAAGYVGVSLPREHGGGGRPRSWQAVVSHEAAYHDAPLIDTAAALVAPTVLQFGSPEQRAAFLPPAAAGTVNGCIAYTESGAGSDLAGIETTAERRDGTWVLRGEKVLVTGPHKSEWCCTIARTEPGSERGRGLSMFLVDLRVTPGARVERVPTANRWTLGTIHFEDATVPAGSLLGEEGAGWRQLGAALLNERSGMAWLGWARRDLEAIAVATAGTRDRRLRDAVAALVTDHWLGCRLSQRVLDAQDAGEAPVVASSAAKVWATELLTRIAAVGARVVGPATLTAPRWFADPDLGAWFAYELVERRHPPLSVGANEIQRTTIAQLGLGLPRDPA